MTSKEEAKQIYLEFSAIAHNAMGHHREVYDGIEAAKQCAIIYVEGLIKALKAIYMKIYGGIISSELTNVYASEITRLEEVKKEIQAL